MSLTLALGFYALPLFTHSHPRLCMNYSDINAATAHHINGDLPLASRYYNKIFRRISGPPPWLLRQLYNTFEEVKTPKGSFLHYNPRWNKTIEEIVPSYDYRSCNRPG